MREVFSKLRTISATGERIIRLSLILLPLCGCGAPGREAAPATTNPVAVTSSAELPCTDINSATAEELMRLPGIGEAMAQRIIAHRERNGRFRRPVDLILVEGISEKKFRALAPRICAR